MTAPHYLVSASAPKEAWLARHPARIARLQSIINEGNLTPEQLVSYQAEIDRRNAHLAAINEGKG